MFFQKPLLIHNTIYTQHLTKKTNTTVITGNKSKEKQYICKFYQELFKVLNFKILKISNNFLRMMGTICSVAVYINNSVQTKQWGTKNKST